MRLFIVFIICLFPLIALSQQTVQGEITGETTWAGEIFVTGDVVISKEATLYINAGTKVIIAANSDATASGKDPEHVEIIVLGELLAEGHGNNGRIVFTSNSPKPQFHDWDGIAFKNIRDISILEHCLIEYANKAITCYGSSPIIESCEIRYNEYAGISCEVRAAPIIRNTTIVGNEFAGINCELAATPIIEKSIISQNANGIVVFDRSNPDLGRRFPDEGQSSGENFIVNNFENNIYNYSTSDIFAQNNLWNTSNVAEIQTNFFDKKDNASKGSILLEPLFRGSDVPVALLALNTNQQPETQLVENSADLTAEDAVLENDTESPDVVTQPVEESNTRNQEELAAQNAAAAPPPQQTASDNAAAEKTAPEKSKNNNAEYLASAAIGANALTQESNIPETSLSNNAQPVTRTETAGTQQVPEKPVAKEPEITGPVIEFQLDSRQRQYVKKTKPNYPDIYQKTGFEGKVMVEVIVGLKGEVEKYRVLKSDGEFFTMAVEKAIVNYKYKPGTFQGKPVKFKIVEPFYFKLAR